MKIYPSKLLLFGEYAVIKGADALAMPYPHFGGQWRWASANEAVERQARLPQWCEYLKLLDSKGQLLCPLNLDAFARDLFDGLYFDSNIPTGYGLGSSGALCAGLYDRYAVHPIQPNDAGAYGELKSVLAQLESFFHGSSSGVDPLVSYLNRPLRLGAGGRIEVVTLPEPSPGTPVMFLLDSGVSRQTGPLVQWFLSQCEDPAYLEQVESQLIPATNAAVAVFLGGQWDALYNWYSRISTFQLTHFEAMILPAQRESWARLHASGDCLFKLCGAGGGGFLMGITRDWGKCRLLLPDSHLQRLF